MNYLLPDLFLESAALTITGPNVSINISAAPSLSFILQFKIKIQLVLTSAYFLVIYQSRPND